MQHTLSIEIEDDDYTPAVPVVRTTTPKVTSTIGAPRRKPADATHLFAGANQAWTGEQLQAYVLRKIAELSPATRITMKPERMAATFNSFATRHPDARQIAEFAFEGQLDPGWWLSAPITPSNFCKNSDPHFALPIRAMITS